ncbi:hypothetical protein RDABS01_032192 [Bienertia sinuspersici]
MEAGLQSLVVEMDCLNLYKQLQQGKSDNSSFGMIVRDILMLASKCNLVTFSHVSRKENTMAHKLAQISRNYDGFRVWLEEVPMEVFRMVVMDSHLAT